MAAKEKEAKESKLRELAQKAREERAGLRLPSSAGGGGGGNDDERERDELRQERHKERQRQRNIDRAAPDRRSKLERNRERDISEQIALGLPARAAQGTSGDAIFDSRLFNQSKGLSSGFNDDEGTERDNCITANLWSAAPRLVVVVRMSCSQVRSCISLISSLTTEFLNCATFHQWR